jgi:NodT family efflux transporter outer membrane factor (OMF) lipoprotein
VKRTSVCLLALTAMACASTPARRAPAPDFTVPTEWSAGTQVVPGSAPEQWWAEFDDPDLDAAVTEALARNHDLEAATARLDQALAIARIEGADLFPQAAANLDGVRQKRIFVGFPFAGNTTSTQWSLSLDVSWEIDLWGRLRARKSAALAEAEAARAEQSAARLSIAAQTAKAWFAVIAAREQLELAEQTARTYTTSAEQVRARYERGVRPSLDLRLALSELDDARALAAGARRQLDTATRQLETLLARYPAGELVGQGTLPRPGTTLSAGLPSELMLRRPDLVAAERTLAAGGARVRAARAALFPRLGIVGSRGRVGEHIDDLLDADFSVWSLAANLTQPLFEGGRLRGNLDLERARERELLAGYFAAVLDAYREVEQFLAAEHHLADRERELTSRSEQAGAAHDLAKQRYLAGLEDYVTVLDAQRTELSARSQLIGVRAERLETRVDLYLSLGGGFDAESGAAADSVADGSENPGSEDPS